MSIIGPILKKTSTSVEDPDVQIRLLDNTTNRLEEDREILDSEDESNPPTPTTPAAQSSSRGGLRQELARRKYAKYTEERYDAREARRKPHADEGSNTNKSRVKESGAVTSSESKPIGNSSAVKDGRLRRGGRKVKDLLGRRKWRGVKDGDAAIDILYENQRGSFVFGRPLFSSRSLLNFDPSAWTTSRGEPSPVDVTNAQLPDPSWEWSWTTWYVDISQDVDEQGWEYSFMFQRRFPWHGTHPWGYSWVRRRRWIRKRVRKHRHLADGRVEGGQAMKDAHKLNADYFTIHASAGGRSPSITSAPSTVRASSMDLQTLVRTNDEDYGDIDDLPTLIQRLKKSEVDREKMNMVLKYIEQGRQDVYYLADEIPHILSLFMFQYSRRQLLMAILRKIDAASDHREEHRRRDEPEYVNEKQKIDSLLKAVKGAENQIQQLEYWSDIHDIQNKGEYVGAGDEAQGWNHGWQGPRSNQSENAFETPGISAEVTSTEVKSSRSGIAKGKQPFQEPLVAEQLDQEHDTVNDDVKQYDPVHAKLRNESSASDSNFKATLAAETEKENQPPAAQH